MPIISSIPVVNSLFELDFIPSTALTATIPVGAGSIIGGPVEVWSGSQYVASTGGEKVTITPAAGTTYYENSSYKYDNTLTGIQPSPNSPPNNYFMIANLSNNTYNISAYLGSNTYSSQRLTISETAFYNLLFPIYFGGSGFGAAGIQMQSKSLKDNIPGLSNNNMLLRLKK